MSSASLCFDLSFESREFLLKLLHVLDAVGIGAIVTGEQRRRKSIVIVAAPPNMPIPLALVWR
ncbi:MAG TPA: hypothetical protein VII23_15435 [Terriglobales bacterium]